MSRAAKYAEWRARHTDKDVALRKAIGFRLGMYRGETSKLATETVDGWCGSILGALLGWGDEPKPEELAPPRTVPAMPTSGERPPTQERA